jgi:hypothetical protein
MTLLVLTSINLVLLLGFGLGWFRSPPPPCDRPVLLQGSGTAYSDFHDDKKSAEDLARSRVQGAANDAAAAAVTAYQCSSTCPTKRGSTASADITNVRPGFGPPPGAEESRWFASASFNWFATVVCQ